MSTEATLPIADQPSLVVHRQTSQMKIDSAVFYGVVFLLFLGPLAFGGGESWSRFIIEASSVGLLLAWLTVHVLARDLPLTDNPLFRPMLGFIALVAFQLAAVTAYRGRTLSGGLQYGAYGALCFLMIQCFRRSAQVKIVTTMFSIFGSAIAVIAVLQSLTAADKLYWIWKPELGGWMFGPYVNHNHYAGLMEMLIPVPLVFSLTSYARGRKKVLALSAAALMACTIFLSGSRGGMIAFVAEIGFLALLAPRKRSAEITAWAIPGFLVLVFGLLAWLGAWQVADRIASIRSEARTELSGGTRIAIDRDAVRMFMQRPISGWGLGVFPDVYPRFRSFYTTFYVNRAHNDYLQLLVETGALGFSLMIWWMVLLYRGALRKVAHWHSDINAAVALAAVVGCTGILVHSFLDSNLQIPGNAALFYVLCVVAAMEPTFSSTRRIHRRHSTLDETTRHKDAITAPLPLT